MAKLQGPLLSVSASGSIGTGLTYSSRRSGAQVRFQRKQKDITTPGRVIVRGNYQLGLVLWNALPSEEKAYWNTMERQGFVEI